MITSTYVCDICGKKEKDHEEFVGLDLQERKEDSSDTAEYHLCFRCISTIQGVQDYCSEGFQGCTGGPRCESNHDPDDDQPVKPLDNIPQ